MSSLDLSFNNITTVWGGAFNDQWLLTSLCVALCVCSGPAVPPLVTSACPQRPEWQPEHALHRVRHALFPWLAEFIRRAVPLAVQRHVPCGHIQWANRVRVDSDLCRPSHRVQMHWFRPHKLRGLYGWIDSVRCTPATAVWWLW